jgi:hypothetical protein
MPRPTILAFILAPILASSPRAIAADDGTIDILAGEGQAVWRAVEPGWIRTDSVVVDPMKPNLLKATATPGGTIWVNGEKGRLRDLYTKQTFGDCTVHIEFLLAKRSNSGIKFHGVYEIQIHDSFGLTNVTGEHCGGIYPRSVQNPRYTHIDDGIAPRVNACKAPGEWQTLDVRFRAPRFDPQGQKTANAMIAIATLNGQRIHENQEMKTPTGANWQRKETATGPFMWQADHGPIAVRKFTIRADK